MGLGFGRPTVLGFVKAAAVLILVGAVVASPAVAFYEEPGINGVASKLAGRSVEVRCFTEEETLADQVLAWGASGYVEGLYDASGRWWPSTYAVLAYGVCETIFDVVAWDLRGRTLDDASWAILVLVHESGHLKAAKWSGNESKTQCWALQHYKATMQMLGIRDLGVQRAFYWQALEIQKLMPAQYQLSPSCKLPKLRP